MIFHSGRMGAIAGRPTNCASRNFTVPTGNSGLRRPANRVRRRRNAHFAKASHATDAFNRTSILPAPLTFARRWLAYTTCRRWRRCRIRLFRFPPPKRVVCYRVPRSRSAQTHKFVAARLIAPMEPECGFVSFVPIDFSVPGGEQEQTQKGRCGEKRAGKRASGGQRD